MASLHGLAYDRDALPETCHEDGHIDGCPGRAGGDHEVAFRYSRSAPKTSWCFWCRRATDGGRRVDVDGREEAMCDECWTGESPGVPLDMTEPEGREGMPEFNGAFDRW